MGRLKRRAHSTRYRSPQQSPQQLPFQFLLVGTQGRINANRRGLVGDPVDGMGASAGLEVIGQTSCYPASCFLFPSVLTRIAHLNHTLACSKPSALPKLHSDSIFLPEN